MSYSYVGAKEMRGAFRPHREPRATVVRDYDFMRDLAAIRVTDGTLTTSTPFPGELLDGVGEPPLIGIALDAFEETWARIIEPRAARMRAAYDRRRRSRKRGR
jgi:hypothetical protein